MVYIPVCVCVCVLREDISEDDRVTACACVDVAGKEGSKWMGGSIRWCSYVIVKATLLLLARIPEGRQVEASTFLCSCMPDPLGECALLFPSFL